MQRRLHRVIAELIDYIRTTALVFTWFFLFLKWTGGYSGANSPGSVAWIIWPTIDAVVWTAFGLSYLQQSWSTPRSIDLTLSYLGTISFSFYLWHSPIISAMALHTDFMPFGDWIANFLLIVMPTIIAVSSVSYFVIEKPFFSFRTRYAQAIHSSAGKPIRSEVV